MLLLQVVNVLITQARIIVAIIVLLVSGMLAKTPDNEQLGTRVVTICSSGRSYRYGQVVARRRGWENEKGCYPPDDLQGLQRSTSGCEVVA